MSTSGGSSGGAGLVSVVTTDLSAAEILALHTTPITLVAAPGAGKGWRITALTFVFTWVTTAYASADGRVCVGSLAQIEDDYSPWETDPAGVPGFMTAGPGESPTGDWVVELRQTGQTSITPPEMIDNEPLAIFNPNDPFVDGDGTMTVTVWYSEFDL